MAVRLIRGPSGKETHGIVQNPDQRDLTRNTKKTPRRLVSSRLDLKIEQDEIDETLDIDISEDGDFSAKKLSYDRKAHVHHVVTGHNAHTSVFSSISQIEFKLKKTHDHNNSFNHKTRLYIFHLTTHFQWLNTHHKDKTQIQATPITNLLKQVLVLCLSNDPIRRQSPRTH